MVNDPLKWILSIIYRKHWKEVYDLINNQAKPFQAEIQEVEQLIAQKNNIQAKSLNAKLLIKL